MSWFDEGAGRSLLSVLHESFRSAWSGSVTVVGRDGGGQVYFAAREVVFATCDGQIPLRAALELSGAADVAEMGQLVRTSNVPLSERGRIAPAVTAVVRDHTEAALADLLELGVGSARVETGESPPLGVLISVPLAELARGAALVDVRARAAALRRTPSEPRPAPAAPVVAVVPAVTLAPVGGSRASALRRLIGAVRAG